MAKDSPNYHKDWTAEHDELVRLHYPKGNLAELRELVGRDYMSVKRRAHQLKVKRCDTRISYAWLFHIGEELNKGRSLKDVASDINGNAGSLSQSFKKFGINLAELTKPTDHYESNFRLLLSSYKGKGYLRGFEFELKDEQFRTLTQGNCNYCDKAPAQKCKTDNGRDFPYVYNGIDRVDSNKGYVLSNCVSCCRDCNVFKMNSTLENMIERACKIAIKFGGLKHGT